MVMAVAPWTAADPVPRRGFLLGRRLFRGRAGRPDGGLKRRAVAGRPLLGGGGRVQAEPAGLVIGQPCLLLRLVAAAVRAVGLALEARQGAAAVFAVHGSCS